MHIITILRYYLGYSQTELAQKSEVTYADINEMENKPAYGMISKYQKVAKCLHVPVHAIVTNDILSVPESFFSDMKPAEYIPAAKSKKATLGRQGEDAVFELEKIRLASVNLNLSRLVIPCYKLHSTRGYDIISYKDDGTPMFIEVKNSEGEVYSSPQLTSHEHNTAVKLTKQGFEYWVYHFSAWGTDNQFLQKREFQDLINEGRISPVRYSCDLKPRKEIENGFLHFRKKMGISQIEAANLMEIPVSCLCKYETGENQCPVTACQKMTILYGATVDELLQDHPVCKFSPM